MLFGLKLTIAGSKLFLIAPVKNCPKFSIGKYVIEAVSRGNQDNTRDWDSDEKNNL